MSLFAASGGGSSAVGPTSGGKVYPFNNISTTPIIVAQANPQRASITFHNPGATPIFVAPVLAQGNGSIAPTSPTNQPLTPTPTTLGGCFMIYPSGGQVTFTGETQGAWQAFSSSGSGNPFTVAESNV